MDRIDFVLNRKNISIETEGSRRLLDLLRDDFSLTGPKEGCGEGECGACSVFIDGQLSNSCLVPVGNIKGRSVETIEAFRETERFKLLEKCFSEAGAVQCGICTPGMIMASENLLRVNNNPDETEIREGISGNLCRCTGYNMIIEAVKMAADKGRGLW